MNPSFNIRRYLIVLVFALCVASLPAYSAHKERPSEDKSTAAQADAAQRPASTERTGQLKFQQNCSRCHEAPQGFSSRISGTILRHMRVRASLSAADEREILRFLNP